MDQLLSMGFTEEVATQALASTGGKSILKATEWILMQKPDSPKSSPNVKGQHQSRVDRFFQGNSPKTGNESANPMPSEHSRIVVSSPCDVVDSDYRHNRYGDQSKSFMDKTMQNSENAEPFYKKQKVEQRDSSSQARPFKFPLRGSTKPNFAGSNFRTTNTPLSERMRPTAVDEVLGQDHLLGKNCMLRSLLECDRLPSILFWGPPGTGKTSLTKAIANSVSYRFSSLSAVTSGLKEVREVLEEAKRMKKMGQRTLFFVDEVHRFNKAQQDAFLPVIEDGSIVFIGATTENPSFEVNNALLSRCRVLTLNKLLPEHIRKLLERAISDSDKGLIVSVKGVSSVSVDDEAIEFLSAASDGDARVALNALEIAASAAVAREKEQGGGSASNESRNEVGIKNLGDSSICDQSGSFKKFEGGEMIAYTPCKSKDSLFEAMKKMDASYSQAVAACDSNAHKSSKGNAWITGGSVADGVLANVTLNDVKEALQCKSMMYDKTGEEHYNIISALHKSMRGSDANAALYWLARMLEGGENPLYIARRLIRFASEDVGLADPNALTQAVACYQACHFLGMPECNVNLAQCVAYLALAPKSVAVYKAIGAAQEFVREKGQNEPVPLHLRNAPTKLMKELGYAKGYIYPPSHTSPVEQQYLPSNLLSCKFFNWPEDSDSK